MRDCAVCSRPLRHDKGPLCSAHESRKRRFGSPTAYACAATPRCCQRLFDNEETQKLAALMGRDLAWERYTCPDCRRTCALEGCEKTLAGKQHNARYCSRAHRDLDHVPRARDAANLRRWGSIEPEPEPCLECGTLYTPHVKVRGRKSFCHQRCRQRANYRKKKAAGAIEGTPDTN